MLCPNESDTLFTQTYDSLINGLIPIIWIRYREQRTHIIYPPELSIQCSDNIEWMHWIVISGVCRILVVNEHLHGADGWNQYWTGYSLCGRYCRIGFAAGQTTVSDENYIEWSLNGVPIPGSANDTLLVTTSGIYMVFILGPVMCSNYNCLRKYKYPNKFLCNVLPGSMILKTNLISFCILILHTTSFMLQFLRNGLGQRTDWMIFLGRTSSKWNIITWEINCFLEFIPKGCMCWRSEANNSLLSVWFTTKSEFIQSSTERSLNSFWSRSSLFSSAVLFAHWLFTRPLVNYRIWLCLPLEHHHPINFSSLF